MGRCGAGPAVQQPQPALVTVAGRLTGCVWLGDRRLEELRWPGREAEVARKSDRRPPLFFFLWLPLAFEVLSVGEWMWYFFKWRVGEWMWLSV